ncbi:peptidylprolyl isomerase [Luteolibacter ambystomatis]|uniref:peptidylprolyl isomerase n=1 Tax=Luteolibacter ambystomatis TaxID=2824561 RepID=A0A975G7U4_9BACT|nr:peptidylprolyl isomerase [Luteolibacter ambystomatis]QUE50345.1 peptidylprolyl isomerase [Luteolibacter ambystomatis]
MRKTLFALVLAVLPLPAFAQVYADFQTSLGNFTCQLNYAETPKTVANFVTLAEGTRPWLDESTGLVSTIRPAKLFYDGLTFHRVVDNEGFRIIQAGSRKGDGTDGPGYNFPDEFKESVPASYKFDQPYLLAMANSGLNTNESQFFITGCPITQLEGKHTVFGHVISGQNVVEAILSVPTTSDDQNPDNDDLQKPLTPVVIQHVAIRRVGRDATRFVATRVTLPKVTAPRFRSATTPGVRVFLAFNQAAKTVARSYYSEDAGATWELSSGRYIGPGEKMLTSMLLDIPAASVDYDLMHRLSLITYPADLVTPGEYLNTQFYAENESGSYLFRFNSNGEYEYHIETASSEIKEGKFYDDRVPSKNQFYYVAEGYSAEMYFYLGNDGAYRFHLAPSVKSKTGMTTGRQRGFFYSQLHLWETKGKDPWAPYEDNTDFSWSVLPKVKK